jgi:hypothetical protein
MTQRHEEKDDAIVVEGRLYGRQDSHFTERIHAAVQYCQSSWASGARFSCKPARWLDADRHRKCLQSRLRTCDFPVNIRRRFTHITPSKNADLILQGIPGWEPAKQGSAAGSEVSVNADGGGTPSAKSRSPKR